MQLKTKGARFSNMRRVSAVFHRIHRRIQQSGPFLHHAATQAIDTKARTEPRAFEPALEGYRHLMNSLKIVTAFCYIHTTTTGTNKSTTIHIGHHQYWLLMANLWVAAKYSGSNDICFIAAICPQCCCASCFSTDAFFPACARPEQQPHAYRIDETTARCGTQNFAILLAPVTSGHTSSHAIVPGKLPHFDGNMALC